MDYQRFIPEGWERDDTTIVFNDLKLAKDEGRIIQGLVTKCDQDFNLHVTFGNNITGMVPRSEVENFNLAEDGLPRPSICINKVNKIIQFKVQDTSEDVILSRKAVGEDAGVWIKSELEVGQLLKGIVRNVQSYGAFVEIGGGAVGLLHIEDISIARIKSPLERFKIGQRINVMVKTIDKQTGRLILTYKELLGTWEENIKDYEEGSTVIGIAREIEKANNGIFIELKPNLVGLADYKDGIEYGQKLSVYIKKIIPEKKKIKLVII